MTQHGAGGEGIAIIGMAGRFPGASNVDEFWRNLRDGIESIARLDDDDLIQSGVDPDLFNNPAYVRAGGVLDQVEYFDAAFFGYTAHEAQLMDPQHRVLMECAWEALEHAGHDVRSERGRVGVYAGSGPNAYLFNLLAGRELMPTAEDFQLILGNDRDHLATSISYKLDLRGPSLTIQTACSTSLVAVHVACQSLLIGECDLALAGGVSISVPHRAGYLHQEGMILSPDGHCRAFDARAQGTVGSSGAGLVVLRRLADALADGDTILAVIRGSAINNDGAAKAGFTAPSVNGQAEVIAEALAVADVDASTISYVEAHGTGTPLGDPIEIAALAQAFGMAETHPTCAIGSVKTNIGHTDAAAGVAGLMKVALALQNRQLPPSLHFETPNPKLDLDSTPFRVNATLVDWTTAEHTPRRAGVSSFGIGGTNAHVVVEEAPTLDAGVEPHSEQLLILSARTRSALDTATRNLIGYGRQHPDLSLADMARTLQVGRHAFDHRRAVTASTLADALDVLDRPESSRVSTGARSVDDPRVAFMFPGQGAQYAGMLRDLYAKEPLVRELVDSCSKLLRPHLGIDLRHALFATEYPDLDQTWLTQPALFVSEYALARLWMEWGIQPRAMIGHSLGEYVAACLAGVFSLEDGLALVAERGRLMQSAPSGAMLAVLLAEQETTALLGQRLSLASSNAPNQCVVAGSHSDVEELEQRLAAQGVQTHRLRTSHAFHSSMLDPIVESFAACVASVDLQAPRIPFISNVSGTWITAAQATDPAYWAAQVRQTVRFADGIQQLADMPADVLLEVGPGRALSGLARGVLTARRDNSLKILTSLPDRAAAERVSLLDALGRLWLTGAPVDWPAVQGDRPGRRIPLPTYPFERKRYWVDPPSRAVRPTVGVDVHGANDTAVNALEEAAVSSEVEVMDGFVSPRNQTERMVANVWQELLGLERIGVTDDFIQLGGNSLLATQVAARLRGMFSVELPLSRFLQAPTIEGLSVAIEDERLERANADDITRLLGEIAQLSAEEVSRLLAADGLEVSRA